MNQGRESLPTHPASITECPLEDALKHLSLYIESHDPNHGWHSYHHCVSWREVRKVVRSHRWAEPLSWAVTRCPRRRPDPLSRTMNRIGIQALNRAGL